MRMEMQTMEHYSALGYAISIYQQDHNDAYPNPLGEVAPYCYSDMKAYFFGSPQSPAIYRIPAPNQGRVPMCWASSPHPKSKKGPPYRRCVLYSNFGAAAILEEDFLREVHALGVQDPNAPITQIR